MTQASSINGTTAKLAYSLSELRSEYLSEEHACPWILGFSGGKDSTLVAQLVFEMLLDLAPSARRRQVIILSNDTMVESPVLATHLKSVMQKIEVGADALELPIRTVITHPATNQTFWVNLIGRGYPAPNRQFRWCTDRMKI